MKIFIFLLSSVLIISSCSNDEIDNYIELNDNNNKEILREISLLIGETLKNQDVRREILETVDNIDSYGNAVSFALLLGVYEKSSNYEQRKLQSTLNKGVINNSNMLFKTYINELYNSNKEKFKELNKVLNEETSDLSRSELTELNSYLIENELELYFPYKDNFDWNNLISFTVTYEDENPDGNYDGFKYLGMTYEEVSNIVDDYLYENPTAAIIPLDNDYLGEDVGVVHNNETFYLNPNLSFEDITGFYDNIYGNAIIQNNSGNTAPTRVRLTQNVNPYTFFNENHVLTNFIPEVRITDLSWKRLLSKSHRTRIARAGATVAVNPNGTFTAMPNTFYYDFDLSRKDLKDKRWKKVNIMFDPNWHKAKGSQQIIVWTKRRRASNSTVAVKNEFKLDAQGNYTPNTSLSITFNANSDTGAKFRGNVELDRDQVLTTIIGGSEYGDDESNTRSINGANLSVRRVAQKFEYVFDMYYTNL